VPRIEVVFFQDDDGTVPLLEWFDSLPQKAQDKCRVRIERLQEMGHQLRRPEADFLRDGIYELRAKHLGVNYRILYFFHGKQVVVLAQGFSKQHAKVPEKEIKVAIERRKKFQSASRRYRYKETGL